MMFYVVLKCLRFSFGFYLSVGTPEECNTYVVCPGRVKFQQYKGKEREPNLHPIGDVDLHAKKSAVRERGSFFIVIPLYRQYRRSEISMKPHRYL